MTNDDKTPPEYFELWKSHRSTPTADKNLSLILGSVKYLPMPYWKPLFFFMGAKDEELMILTSGRFPLTTQPGKTHPVISLKPLPDKAGYKVNPCSSVRPWKHNVAFFISKGCRLKHTGYEMDRDSFIVEHIEVPLPARLGAGLTFKGEVPPECVKAAG